MPIGQIRKDRRRRNLITTTGSFIEDKKVFESNMEKVFGKRKFNVMSSRDKEKLNREIKEFKEKEEASDSKLIIVEPSISIIHRGEGGA